MASLRHHLHCDMVWLEQYPQFWLQGLAGQWGFFSVEGTSYLKPPIWSRCWGVCACVCLCLICLCLSREGPTVLETQGGALQGASVLLASLGRLEQCFILHITFKHFPFLSSFHLLLTKPCEAGKEKPLFPHREDWLLLRPLNGRQSSSCCFLPHFLGSTIPWLRPGHTRKDEAETVRSF